MSGIEDILNDANVQYAEEGVSDLSDDAFDALREYAESKGIEIDTVVAIESGEWGLVEHRRPMGSMPLCPKTEDELRALTDRHGGHVGLVSVKYDGMSIELQYTDGALSAAVLRGDGHRGEDVLDNVSKVSCVPATVPVEGEFSVFGELVISWNNLDALNEYRNDDGMKPYKSPRNAVALVRSRSANPRHLKLFRVRAFDTFPRLTARQDYTMRQLTMMTQGPTTQKFDPVDVKLVSSSRAWQSMKATGQRRDEFQYQMDGFVFRCKDDTCIKLKFDAQSAVTKVVRVVEQLSNTGIVAPVVEVEPVTLVGAEVKRASGHNSTLMASRLAGLGPGATVIISRRGDVIPHVEAVVEPSDEEWVPRSDCPSCGARILQDGTVRRCSADAGSCPGTSVGLIVEFCRRMGIDGFGPGVVSALIVDGLVEVPADLYYLDPDLMAYSEQPGGGKIGETMSIRLVRRVSRKIDVSWGELLGSLCIPGCAKSVMGAVAERYPDPDSLREVSVDDLVTIDGIGPSRAASIASYVHTRWDDVIQPLLEVVSIRNDDGPLSGKAFCITLNLRSCGRTEMESAIRAAGGVVKSSVSRKVTHLVCNFPEESTTKLKRARELGIPIISEDELIDMMGTEVRDKEIHPDDEF